MIRQGLEIILSGYEDIEIVAQGANGFEALELCATFDPHVMLMDVRMPQCNGVEGTKLVKSRFPQVKILILTTFKDTGYIQDALKNGASGYLLKDSSHDLIYKGIKAVMSGNIVFHPEVADDILSHVAPDEPREDFCAQYGLTVKECELIELIAQGLSNKEIGDHLYLSEGTIKNYVSNILGKLELRDRTQIVIFAYKQGLAK